MKIDFNEIEAKIVPNLRNGDGEIINKMVALEACNIMNLRVKKGCSIGYHKHEGSYEVLYVVSGIATFIDDGEEYTVTAGNCQCCPENHEHSVRNEQDEDLLLLAVIPKTK